MFIIYEILILNLRFLCLKILIYYRICVPADESKNPFIDISCAISNCKETVEETQKQECIPMKELKHLNYFKSDKKANYPVLLNYRPQK